MKKILSLLAISFSLAFAYTEKDFQGWWTFSGKFELIDPMFVVMATTNEYGTRYISFDILVDLAITAGSYKFLQFEANRKCSSTIINCPGWRFRNNKIELENSNIHIEIISAKEIDIYQYNQKYTLKKAGTVEQFKKWVNQITQEQAKARKQKEEKEAKEKKDAERKHAEWLASPEYAEMKKAEAEKAEAERKAEEAAKKAKEEEAARKAAEEAAKEAATKKAAEEEAQRKQKIVEALIKNRFTIDTRDNKKYKVVIIGNQIWLGENLNYDATGSKCYDNNPENCKKYGRLYDFETAKKSCPADWHLSSRKEWRILIDEVDDYKAGDYLKAIKGWYIEARFKNNSMYGDGFNPNGKDKYGFSALPGGNGSSNGSFYNVENRGFWWADSDTKDGCEMSWDSNKIKCDYNNGSPLFSVRCLLD